MSGEGPFSYFPLQVFCILSCMILFSHYISTYLVRKTIEETSRQKNVLAQNIENEIDSINSIMNNIYYNTIKKYDIQDKNFKTILANEITSNSETIYGLALYDTSCKKHFLNILWMSGEGTFSYFPLQVFGILPERYHSAF